MKKTLVFIYLICIVSCSFITTGDKLPTPSITGKKLIQLGHDEKTPSYVASHLSEIESKGLDGITMKIDGLTDVFRNSNQALNTSQFESEMNALKSIKSTKLTDNFIQINVAAEGMNWFDDSAWRNIVDKVAYLARNLKEAGLKGILFDAEAYGKNPFKYSEQDLKETKSFSDYEAIVRKRGAEFMNAIQNNFPDADIMSLFMISVMTWEQYWGRGSTNQELISNLPKLGTGLIPAFMNGMLDVIKPGITIHDGNEQHSYYNTNAAEYQAEHDWIDKSALDFIAPENRAKYQNQVKVANAIYADHIFFGSPKYMLQISSKLTADEKLQWYESNVYNSLKYTDEYAWVYNEKINFWNNSNMPSGMIEAQIDAQTRIDNNQDLGFSIDSFINRAKSQL